MNLVKENNLLKNFITQGLSFSTTEAKIRARQNTQRYSSQGIYVPTETRVNPEALWLSAHLQFCSDFGFARTLTISALQHQATG